MMVTLPKLEKYQKDVLEYHIANPNRNWIVTVSPRQVGKSILLEVLLVYASLKETNSASIAISPIFSQSRKLFNDIQKFAAPIIKKANSSVLEIEFINGSMIKLASAEQGDNLRGFTVKKSGILVIDEAVWIKESFFYDICVPMTNVYGGNIFLFSTPRTKNGLFWELYSKDGIDNIKVFNWKNYDLSKYLTPEILEMYRKQLPKISFLCEYMAEFCDGNGTVFYDFKKCIKDNILDITKPITIGIDWGSGSGNDFTVLTFGQLVNNKIKIINQIAFNDKSPTDTIRFIREEVEKLVKNGFKEINIIVEKNSIGAIYHSNLVEAVDEFEQQWNDSVSWRDEIEINCGTFVTTNTSKKKAIEQLVMLFENDLIEIPNDNELVSQLSLFEAKVDKETGTIKYAVFAPGVHDDRPLSMMFVTQKLWNELSEDYTQKSDSLNYIGK